MKELLGSAVLQMKAKAQWEVAGYSDRARDLHKTLMLWGITPHTASVFTTWIWAQGLLLPSVPYEHTQTDRHTGSVTAPQASEGPQSSSRNRRQQLGQRWLKAQPYSGCLGPKQQPRGSLPLLEGHSGGKFGVPFLCPSSPLESITVQLNNTWWSRVQPHVLPFPLGQSSHFKRNYGSAVTGKAHSVWAIPSQWWFCSSFQQFWIYMRPFFLGQEFQVPLIHYWRTESERQTNLSFAF